MFFLNRFSGKKILIIQKKKKTSTRQYFQKKFNDCNIDWKNMYLLLRIVAKDSTFRAFQLKLEDNFLYLDKICFKFGKSGSPVCSFCNLKDNTPYHLF